MEFSILVFCLPKTGPAQFEDPSVSLTSVRLIVSLRKIRKILMHNINSIQFA